MPQQESRVKKSLLNARVNLIFYFLSIILAFFSRKIFLDMLGADFIGLTSTLHNLLGFLNLAEMGIGMAIGYVLYKPLYEHDQNKINEVISVFGYMYSWIGKIILVTGCILACFLPLIFANTSIEMPVIFFAFFAFLLSSLIGYFFNYKQTLLGADQKNYVVTAYFQTATIIQTLIQMAMAYYINSYYIWIAIEIIFAIIFSFILNWKINQVYPWLKSEIKQGRKLFKKYPEIIKYTKQLFIHRIGDIVQNQSKPFLIYTFVTLQMVAFYTNYTIIIDKLNALVESILSSTSAGVGNLIAEGNKKKIYSTYWELMSVRFFTASTMCFVLYNFTDPLICLWLGNAYLIDNTSLILIISFIYLVQLRATTNQFLFGHGLFYDTWVPIAECFLYISTSSILGYYYQLPGILGGALITKFLTDTWKPIFLFWKGFKINIFRYWANYIKYNTICIGTIIITSHFAKAIINKQPEQYTYASLIKNTSLTTLIFIVIIFIFLYFFSQGWRTFTMRITNKITNKLVRNS